jgi:hypothetical protein
MGDDFGQPRLGGWSDTFESDKFHDNAENAVFRRTSRGNGSGRGFEIDLGRGEDQTREAVRLRYYRQFGRDHVVFIADSFEDCIGSRAAGWAVEPGSRYYCLADRGGQMLIRLLVGIALVVAGCAR